MPNSILEFEELSELPLEQHNRYVADRHYIIWPARDRSTGDIVQVEVEINGPDSPPAHGVVWSRIRSALYAETRWIELVAREGYRSGDRSVRVSAAALNSAKAAARV